jgi:hypothetical protein
MPPSLLRHSLLVALVLHGCASSSAEDGAAEVLDNGAASLREDELRATLRGGAVDLELPVTRKSGGRLTGRLHVRLIDAQVLPEVVLGEATAELLQTEARQAHRLSVTGLPVDVARAATAGYVLAWRVELPEGQLRGRTSLYTALGHLEVELRGATEVPADGHVPYRVIVRDPSSLAPIVGARVRGLLAAGEGAPLELFSGTTDAHGEHLAAVRLPAGVAGGQLRVEVEHERTSSWATTALRAVALESLALSTDKTIYKPGQTIHLRLLGLSSSKAPLAERDVRVEVLDGKGNKIIKRTTRTDAFGVASLALATAAEVNEGAWTLRAELDGARAERKVPVARYNLPKLKVDVRLERGYGVPGEPARGTIEARYLFGAPVSGALVELTGRVTDDARVEQQRLRTDDEGRVDFVLALPADLPAARLDEGALRLAVEAMVTDSAGQVEGGAATLPLAPGPLTVRVLREAPALVPGVENVLWLSLQDPVGRPIAGQLMVDVGGAQRDLRTGASGLAELRLTPEPGASAVALRVVATDGAERRRERTLSLDVAMGGALVVRSERARYRAGEVARLTVLASEGVSRVHLDVYRAGAGAWSHVVDLDASRRATVEVPLTEAMRGLLVVDALALGASGQVVRGAARVLVDPEDRLDIALEAGRGTYAPGDLATVRVRVRDAAGQPQVASLGLSAVDEAAFVLGGEPDDDLRGIFSLDRRALPAGLGASALLALDEAALRVALAGTTPLAGLEYNSVREELPVVRRALESRVRRDLVALLKRLAPQLLGATLDRGVAEERILPFARALVDPFGQRYRAALGDSTEELRLTSSGADERAGTGDDVTVTLWYGWVAYGDVAQVDDEGKFGRGNFDADGPNAVGGGPPAQAPDPAPAPTTAPEGPAATKVRADFRETILFQPSLITDARGEATLSFPLADSITTWRVTAHGSTLQGQVGSARLGFRTFQDFFVDFDVPLALTRGDEIELPAVVYNYLPTAASVRVTLEPAPWFTLVSAGEQVVELGPSEVRAVRFRVVAGRAGVHALTLRARSGALSDALVREARVAPGGVKDEVSFADRLSGTRTHRVDIPSTPDVIEGGTRVVLTVTPGFGGEAVSGTEALLQEPHGCFEQTTSSAWPNTLVAKYLDVTGQLTPELRERAFGLVSTGYQRLLTFESPTGGFNWWGDADPGNRILSAIMLWHLADMEGVIETDPAVRERTLTWLLAQQSADGSWPSGDALHAGNEVLGTSAVRTTAFIAWALAHTGQADEAVGRALGYLRANLPDRADLYANALAANALGMVDPTGPATSELFARLDAAKVEGEAGRLSWPTEAPSWTGAAGDAAAIETTGLVAYGLLKARAYPGNAAGAVKFLVSNKDAVGTWYNTQATMNALRALLAAASPQGSEAEGTLSISVNGVAQPALILTRADGDVHHTVDLTSVVRPGQNDIVVSLAGQGEVGYHLVRRVHREAPPRSASPELALDVGYESTALTVGQATRVRVRATHAGRGPRDQVVVRVGLAPGMSAMDADLDALVSSGRVSRVEKNARDVTYYLMGLAASETRELSFRVVPRLAGVVEAPASIAYAYYAAAEVRAEVAPTRLTVTP